MLNLLHGWGLNARVFSGFAKALERPTRLLDLPGHGHAPFAPGDLDPARLASSLAEEPGPPCAWLGWSLGGLVAMMLAAHHPARVTKLILVGASPCFVSRPDWPYGTHADVLEAFSAQLALDYEATLRRFLTLQAGVGERAQVRRLMADLKEGGEPDPLALTEGLHVLRTHDIRALLSSIQVATLFVHGSDDKIVPKEAALWSAQQLKSARFCVLGRGHAPFLSDETRTVELIRDFLDE